MFRFLSLTDGIAVLDADGPLVYGEWNRILARMAQRLDLLHLEPGDRVATLLPNSVALLATFYACLHRGLVIVPLSQRMAPRELEAILDDSEPRALLTGVEPPSPAPDRPETALSRLSVNDVRSWAEDPAPVPPLTEPAWPSNHPAMLFYTSGSTGRPKGVLYSHGTLDGVRRVHGEGFSIGSGDRSVLCHCLTTNFVFAQLVVPFLAAGASVHVVPYGAASQAMDAVEAGATFLSLIPWLGFRLIAEAERRGRSAPHSLRVVEVGGDRVPAGFFPAFEAALGVLPREHLGMAEANTFVVNPPAGPRHRAGSVGLPLPHVQVEVRDLSGPLPPGREGQIWVRTPAAMAGYWRDPARTARTLVDGWVATGDVGRLDEDGTLWFVGRIKQIIICDGDNIHPGEVERALCAHPAVARACAVGLPHATRGHVVGACAVPADGVGPVAPDDLTRFLRERLSPVKIPTVVRWIDALPETPAGKLDRDEVRRLCVEGGAG